MIKLILLTILVAGVWSQQGFLSPQQQKVQNKIKSEQSRITLQQWRQIIRLKQEARLQQKRIRQQQLAHQERIRQQQKLQQNKQTPQNQQQLVQQPSQQQTQQVQQPFQQQNQQVQRPQQQSQQVQRPTQQQNQQVQRPSQQQNQPLIQQQTRPQPIIVRPDVEILDDDRDGPFQDGTYYFRYATGDGIQREEGARLISPVTHEVTGSYSYVAPDGTLVAMEYIADENGYRAFPAGNGRINPLLPPEPIAFPPPIRPFLNK